jgi:sulfatase modifying factor 1
MVVVPAGSFLMGSMPAEQEFSVSQGRQRKFTDRENPRHEVSIARAFAVGVFEVTRDQFATFVRETGRPMPAGCETYEPADGKFKRTPSPQKGWLDPGYPQAGDHPAVCLQWDDAHDYARWLAAKTGEPYRLLSEAEWEYVARAGTTTYRYWGDDSGNTEGCRYANVADRTPTPHGRPWQPAFVYDCDDGFWATSPAGRYEPNAFGVHDIIGNVWEWLEDCANESYEGAPADGSAWVSGDCGRRALRGGAFHENGAYTRIAMRGFNTHSSRFNTDGFRVARDLSPR